MVTCTCGHIHLDHNYETYSCTKCKYCTKYQGDFLCASCGLQYEQHKTVWIDQKKEENKFEAKKR